ncbi:hypothetical protein TKK_0006144 [Trichogramma kaykai]|uniref:Kazal-like domain-containing protein n=1 Tax=Trichogramma kaykai TaxID=54128 RepID=A0ABD2XEI2_9HYME
MSKLIVSLVVIAALTLAVSASREDVEDPKKVLPEGCMCRGTNQYDPVCGNNGVTYPNLATLRCANECVKYSIHHMHHGPCKT